jgi:hypothetical protein
MLRLRVAPAPTGALRARSSNSAQRRNLPTRAAYAPQLPTSHGDEPSATVACDLLNGPKAAECWSNAAALTLPNSAAHARCVCGAAALFHTRLGALPCCAALPQGRGLRARCAFSHRRTR